MTRRWAITILAFLIVVLGGIAYRHWPRAVPWEECSTLYRQYAHADGIEATFLRGYQVNDTLSIDVTLLQATDSAGWDLLQNDFSIKQPEDSTELAALEKGGDIFGIIQNNTIIPRLEQSDIATYSYRDRYVTIFHTNTINAVDKSTISQTILLHKINQLNQQL